MTPKGLVVAHIRVLTYIVNWIFQVLHFLVFLLNTIMLYQHKTHHHLNPHYSAPASQQQPYLLK